MKVVIAGALFQCL